MTAGDVTIHFTDASGETRSIPARIGNSVMEAAVQGSIDGIEAQCGGVLNCATCHVRVDEKWMDACGARSDVEEEMLEFAGEHFENSRLSCQIQVTQALDGLVLIVPD